MAVGSTSDAGRWQAPALIVLYRVEAPWAQAAMLGPADVSFGSDDMWVEICLPAVDIPSCGHYEARLVRLLAEPGRLACPVTAARTLLTRDAEQLLPTRSHMHTHSLPRTRPSSLIYGDGATEEEYQAMVLAASYRRLTGARDRVIVTCAYEGLLRLGSLELICIEHLERTRNGYRARLVRSKTNQDGKPEYVNFVRRGGPLCSVAAIEAWLALSPWKTGPLVPALSGVPRANRVPSQLRSRSAVDRLVKLAQAVGHDVRPSGHSPRRSGATHLYRETKDLNRVKDALHHRNRGSTGSYIDLSAEVDQGGEAG